MGITCASFHLKGNMFLFNERLKSLVRDLCIGNAPSFSSLVLIPSGPVALETSRLSKISKTSSSESEIEEIVLGGGAIISGRVADEESSVH